MTELGFALYSLFVLVLFGVYSSMQFLLENWETVMLLITNLVAYLAPSPRQKRTK